MAVNPWLACPTYSVNLDDSMERRFAGMPPDLLAKVRSLLRELTAWIPHETRYLADAVRVLTEQCIDELTIDRRLKLRRVEVGRGEDVVGGRRVVV